MPRIDALVRAIALVALGVLAGCEEVTDPPATPDAPTLSPSTQWAGGVVRVTAPTIDADGAAPTLKLAGESLESVEVGDGWADYRLPNTAHGAVTLALGGEQPDSFDIDVLGFRSVQSLGVGLGGDLVVWPRYGSASILALPGNGPVTVENGPLIRVMPGSLGVDYVIEDPLPWTSVGDIRSVGLTYDPDLVLVPVAQEDDDGLGITEVWRLLPTAEIVDTIPFGMGGRQTALLSDSVWLTSSHHDIASYVPGFAQPIYMGQYEESHGIVVSPEGHHGAFRVNGSVLGPPVFSAATGDTVFHVETLFRSYGVDFSPAGDTLYIAGITRSPGFHQLLLAIDANTGAVLHQVSLGPRETINLLRDRYGPWLYVMSARLASPTTYTGEQPVVLVIDTRTMQIVGEMAPTANVTLCEGYCDGAVAAGPDGVFFVTSSDPAVVYAFDRGPAN